LILYFHSLKKGIKAISVKVTLFSEIHIKIISKISLTYYQIAFLSISLINFSISLFTSSGWSVLEL